MKCYEFRIKANKFRPDTPEVSFDLYLFKTVKNMNQWHRRKTVDGHKPMWAAVCQMSTQEPRCLGTLLLALDRLDSSTIVHEAVHMAKLYARKMNMLRDEELLCSVAGYISEKTLLAKSKFRRHYAKT